MFNVSNTEGNVIRSALLLLKGQIIKNHSDHIEKLPQNGKATSDATSEAAEASLVTQLTEIDTILHRWTTTGSSTSKSLEARAVHGLSKGKKSTIFGVIDEEPYENPFTGRMVYPPSADAPGPSDYKRTLSRGETSQQDQFKYDKARQELRGTLDARVIHASSESAEEDSHDSPSIRDALWTPAQLFESLTSAIPLELSFTNFDTGIDNLHHQGQDVSEGHATTTQHDSDLRKQLQSSRKDFNGFTIRRKPVKSSKIAVGPLIGVDQSNYKDDQASAQEELVRERGATDDKPSLIPLDVISKPNVTHIDLEQEEETTSRQLSEDVQEQPLTPAVDDGDTNSVTQRELDFELAMKLAADTPQNLYDFQNADDSLEELEQDYIQAIQDEINRQDQGEVVVIDQLRKMQDELEGKNEHTLLEDQARAKQIAKQEKQAEEDLRLTEIWMSQNLFQFEEDEQIEADRLFALSLSEQINREEFEPLNAIAGSSLVLPELLPRPAKRNVPARNGRQGLYTGSGRVSDLPSTAGQPQNELMDCAVCSDEYEKDAMVRFPCNHAYCRGCLTTSIEQAVQSKTAFHCCNHRANLVSISKLLRANIVGKYKDMVQELDTVNPVYCSAQRCSAFIPPDNIKGGTATCRKCYSQTCASCKRAAHSGICAEDKDGQAFLALSNARRWKKCPRCGNMVERSDGCLHMTCRCACKFCYSCGRLMSVCNGQCDRPW